MKGEEPTLERTIQALRTMSPESQGLVALLWGKKITQWYLGLMGIG